ncbi:MAG: glutathione S-transferase family protein [Sneathiella sp.]
MKLYTSIGPNPLVVTLFAAERGVELELEKVDLRGGENRQEAYMKINPFAQMPALVLEDGSLLTEITVICEYLDEISEGDSLIGTNAEGRADTRRWVRWVDLNVNEPLTNGFRFSEGLPLFKDRMRCIPEAADGLKACAQDKMAFLDEQMDGKDYIVGDRFTLADILLYAFLSFGAQVGQAINPDFKNLIAWYERMSARPKMKG